MHALFWFNWRVPALVLGLLACIWCADSMGQLKPSAIIDWFDILGEGSTLLISLLGLTMIIKTRPSGQVTHLLFTGLYLLSLSLTLDVLDEFYRYPDELRLMSWLESLPMPLGLAVLGWGAVGWLQEQRLINRQLQVREQRLREHGWIDPLTALYTRRYFEQVLQREIILSRLKSNSLVVAKLNVRAFAHFNREHGSQAGDHLINTIAELLVLLVRPTDCVCRDHSDQFLILLNDEEPNTSLALLHHLERTLTKELNQAQRVQFEINWHRVREAHPQAALDALQLESAVVTQNYALVKHG